MLKRRNRHSGHSCPGRLFPFLKEHVWPTEFFQAYLSAFGSQITISLKLLLPTRASSFDISTTSCRTSGGPMVMPLCLPAVRVVLTLPCLCSCCPLCPHGSPPDLPVVRSYPGLGVSLNVPPPKVGPLVFHHSQNHTGVVMCMLASGSQLCPWSLVRADKRLDLRVY